jgi:hypothetical protein
MNVQLTPAALREISVLRAAGYKGAGFLLGSAMGRFVTIEQLLVLDFDRDNGDEIYRSVCASYQQRLKGVFFCRRRPFVLDRFLLDLVAVIDGRQIEIRRCEFSAARRKSVLVPLLEDKEEKWEN